MYLLALNAHAKGKKKHEERALAQKIMDPKTTHVVPRLVLAVGVPAWSGHRKGGRVSVKT